MKQASDLLPWKVTDISVYPYGHDFWSMNPSVHRDNSDGTWRCVARIVDYSMPNGVIVRSKKAGPGHQTRNAMLILDPQSWKPAKIYQMHERDDHPRVSCPNTGYEDMRLFRTDQGGLQGIAASLHLKRDGRTAAGGPSHQPPEQVILSFDAEYNIVAVRPVRGEGFSGRPQKNWVPFDHCVEPRFLYSVDKGSMFDDRGPVQGDAAVVRPSVNAPSVATSAPVELPVSELAPPPPPPPAQVQTAPAQAPPAQVQTAPAQAPPAKPPAKPPDRRTLIRSGTEAQLVRGRRVVIDQQSTRPTATRYRGARSGGESTRVLGTGRALPPKYEGLRGGTQLVRVGDDAWLGIGHEMKFVDGKKYYWHVLYVVNSKGTMTSASEPMKLAPEGIEFAAGMAIEGDRVVVSFGVDDMYCRIGETKLSAVRGILRPVEAR
jgi:hypothetical protein